MTEKQVIVKNLEEDLIVALQEKETEGMQLLQITGNEAPKQIVKKIRECVDRLIEI